MHELAVEAGYSLGDIANRLDRSLSDVCTTFVYYYDYPAEMRELRAERDETSARLAG